VAGDGRQRGAEFRWRLGLVRWTSTGRIEICRQ